MHSDISLKEEILLHYKESIYEKLIHNAIDYKTIKCHKKHCCKY